MPFFARKASAEKGSKYLKVVITRLAKFLEELSKANVKEKSFPFGS